MRIVTAKNLGILGLEFLFLTLNTLGKMQQSISSYVSLALVVLDSKIVPRAFLGPLDLLRC